MQTNLRPAQGDLQPRCHPLLPGREEREDLGSGPWLRRRQVASEEEADGSLHSPGQGPGHQSEGHPGVDLSQRMKDLAAAVLAIPPGVDPERPRVAGAAQGGGHGLDGLQETIPFGLGEDRLEVDPRELAFGVHPLAVDAHDAQSRSGEEGRDAEVGRAVHPRLEEEGAVAVEEALQGPPGFGIGDLRPRPFYIALAAGGGEGRLQHPAPWRSRGIPG